MAHPKLKFTMVDFEFLNANEERPANVERHWNVERTAELNQPGYSRDNLAHP